jgi:hypothetical protein
MPDKLTKLIAALEAEAQQKIEYQRQARAEREIRLRLEGALRKSNTIIEKLILRPSINVQGDYRGDNYQNYWQTAGMAQENPSSPMPKSTNKPRNPNDDPAVLAARINRSGTIRKGFIAGMAAVVVAIVGLMNRSCGQQSKPGIEKEKFVIKVLDKTTGKGISGAKVSLESSDVPPVDTTDSNGVISFPIGDTKKELRIRIDADGYEKDFNLRITPASIIGTQEVRLTPLATPSPAAITAQPPDPAQHQSPSPPRIPNEQERSQMVVRGLVMDETGAG